LRAVTVENRVRSRCTGKERDTESGLDYFGARYYGNALGRFLTPDWSAKPVTIPYADLHDPQTLNLYGYVGNNPLSRRDADGHEVDLTGNAKDKQAEQQRLAANASRTDKNGVKESSLFKQTTDKNGKTTLTLDKNAAASYDGKHSAGYNMLNSAIGAKGTISVQMTDLISDQTVSDGHGNASVSLTRLEPTYDPNLPMKGVNGQVIPNPPQIIAGHEVLGHGLNSILGREHGEATAIGVENILRGEQGLPLRQPDPTKQ
jgi:RHS repeat-associated protein